jgi:pimeloyl-ACP methyl ester carboxylesterase
MQGLLFNNTTMNWEIKEILYDKVPVVYRVYGEGTAIVLLHGYLESAEIWTDFVTYFPNYKIIVPDLPGHGASGVQTKQRVESMALAMAAILRNEEIEQAHWVGHSMGGYVLLALLELAPQLAVSACLFHSHVFADAPLTKEKRSREIEIAKQGRQELLIQNLGHAFATELAAQHSELIVWAKEIARGTTPEGIVACLDAMKIRPDRAHIWQSLSIPNLIIAGKLDNFISAEILETIKLGPIGLLAFLYKSGHQGFLEEATESAELLKSFWNTCY